MPYLHVPLHKHKVNIYHPKAAILKSLSDCLTAPRFPTNFWTPEESFYMYWILVALHGHLDNKDDINIV